MQKTVESSDSDNEIELPDDSDPEILALSSSLISISLIASLVVAQRGWVLQERTYPRLPLFDNPSITTSIEPLLYSAMLIALLLFNFSARKKLLVSIFGIATATTIAFDTTRLQPWLYLLSVMLFLVALPAGSGKKSVGRILDSLRICILGTYLFAGIQKLNISFCQTVVPSMMPKFVPPLPHDLALAIGILAALTEAALAVLLSFAPTSRIGAWLAIFFHAITLWMITHLGWNAVVWPWNVSMMLLVYLLFIRSRTEGTFKLLCPDSLQKVLAVIVFLLLPCLNFIGLWPNYLSAALYSGNVPVLRVLVDPADEERLPSAIRQAIDISDRQKPTLLAERWGIEELGIPSFPEVSALEQLAKKLLESGKFSHSRIYIETFPRFFKGEKQRRDIFLSATES